MVDLRGVDALGDRDDGGFAALEFRRQRGFAVGLLLEDEGGEQGDDFLWLVVGEDVVEDEFGQDQLVGGVNLAGDFALELDAGFAVDEAEVLEHGDALLVVREECEILVGHQEL